MKAINGYQCIANKNIIKVGGQPSILYFYNIRYGDEENFSKVSHAIKILNSYKCQCCGRPKRINLKDGGVDVVPFHAHEVYELYVDHVGKQIYVLLKDIMCLCEGCHSARHWEYNFGGYGNVDPEIQKQCMKHIFKVNDVHLYDLNGEEVDYNRVIDECSVMQSYTNKNGDTNTYLDTFNKFNPSLILYRFRTLFESFVQHPVYDLQTGEMIFINYKTLKNYEGYQRHLFLSDYLINNYLYAEEFQNKINTWNNENGVFTNEWVNEKKYQNYLKNSKH